MMGKRQTDYQEFVLDERGVLIRYEIFRKRHPLTLEQIEKNRMDTLKKYGLIS